VNKRLREIYSAAFDAGVKSKGTKMKNPYEKGTTRYTHWQVGYESTVR